MNFRKRLIKFVSKYQDGRLNYQQSHPDLRDIPYKHGDFVFDLIKKKNSN